jgi:hypothetical protein
MFAVPTYIACGKPLVSTPMCGLIPEAPRVMVLSLGTLRVLDALRVNDDHRGLSSPARFHARNFHQLVQQPVQQGFSLAVRLLPQAKVIVAILPFRGVVRKYPPGTSLLEHVQDSAEYVVQLVAAGPGGLCGSEQLPLDLGKGFSCNVAQVGFSHGLILYQLTFS